MQPKYFYFEKSRTELNEIYFHLAGISRSGLYVTSGHLAARQMVAGCDRSLDKQV